jgi:competence protein ComEA
MPRETYFLLDDEEKEKKFDFLKFTEANKWPIALLLLGLIFCGLGLFFYKDAILGGNAKIEVLESVSDSEKANKIVVEVVGAVEKPGVYEFTSGERIEDALIASGGLSVNASREWVSKNINRAAKLTDGQKIYIYSSQELIAVSSNPGTSSGSVLSGSGGEPIAKININTATVKELESLWGIGPVTAQNIIDHRPYSTVEELLEKKLIKSNVYERNKDKLSVY